MPTRIGHVVSASYLKAADCFSSFIFGPTTKGGFSLQLGEMHLPPSLPASISTAGVRVRLFTNQDPINEQGAKLLRGDTRPFSLREEKNLYAFVGNDPINSIDPYGLDRWIVGGVHEGVVVAVWNKEGKCVTGYKRVDFGPTDYGVILTLGLYYPGWVLVTDSSKPDDSGERYDSDATADRLLLSIANDLSEHPPYYTWFFNCRTFAALLSAVGIETDSLVVPKEPAVRPPIGPSGDSSSFH